MVYIDNLVSVIIPTYNCKIFLRESIDSVLAQSYKKLEIIVVDDGSFDGTDRFVQNLMKEYDNIIYYKNNKNEGAAKSRQKGIEIAKGQYIAFLDADDIWVTSKLRKQIDFMKTNRIAICCSDYEKILEDGRFTGKVIKTCEKIDIKRLLLDCPVGNSTVIVDRYFFKEKLIIPLVEKREDFALWYILIKQCQYIYGYPEILCYYRLRENSVSFNKIRLIPYQWNFYRKFVKCSILKSIIHLCYWGMIKLVGKK